MRRRKLSVYIIILVFILLGLSKSFSQATYSYILFDKDSLETAISETITLKKSYAEIAHKAKEYPDQTIYNYYFKTNQSLWASTDKKEIYQRFRAGLEDYNQMPYDVLVSVTPLTKDKKVRKDVTDAVLQGEIAFIDPMVLLQQSLHDIFFGVYAPMGIIDSLPLVNTKRLDIQLVIKEQDKYHLIEQVTLTELYYLSRQAGLYPNEFNCCGLFFSSPPVNKEHTIANRLANTGKPKHKYPSDRILKESAEEIYKYSLIGNFWTNNDYQYSERNNIRRKNVIYKPYADFYLLDGIGDFAVLYGVGVVNGNFLDYFMGSIPGYYPDKENNPKFNLLFETKSINGIPYEQFLKEKRY